MTFSGNTSNYAGIRAVVCGLLFVWLVLAIILGVRGDFVRAPGAPPLPILAGVLTPIVLFVAALRFVGSFRDFVMSLDLQLAVGKQAWRFGGLGFLALNAYGVLPGLFAWPAGLGDMAIGATAVWIMVGLRERKDFAAGRRFRIWNLLGILDLVVAISLGALSSVLGIGISERITAFPMAQFPLVLIPVFLVPLFVMLHITSLLQSGHLAEVGGAYRCTCPPVVGEPLRA